MGRLPEVPTEGDRAPAVGLKLPRVRLFDQIPIKPPCVKHSPGWCVLAVAPGQAVVPDEGGATPV